MLLSFTATNYGSISSYVTIDLTAINSYHEHDDALVIGEWPGTPARGILPAVVLYGANGSGKSTVLEAFETLCLMVTEPPVRVGESLNYRPHLGLSKEGLTRGSTFAVSLLAKAPSSERLIRYDYSVTFDGKRIMREELHAYPKSRRQKWLVRNGLDISCFNGLRMGKELKGLVNENALALSVIANHPNYEGTKNALPVADWFDRVLMTKAIGSVSMRDVAYTGEMLLGTLGTDRSRTFVRTLLSQSDTGIGDTKVVDHELTPEMVEKTAKRTGIPPEEVPTVLHEVVFEHSFPGGPIDVSLFDESDGTARVFCASGKIATVLEEGGILVADEFDASLHTNLFEELVRLFMTPETNPKGAQLLFSAQNPHLLEARVLRRDQVWFADKDHRGSTHVYPLSDYSPRQGESVANGYIMGRYSAVPVIPDLFGLTDLEDGGAHGA